MKKMTTKSILILFFFTGLLTSCGDDKSLEWLKKVNPSYGTHSGKISEEDKLKTLDQIINEFGEPTEIINIMEDFMNKSVLHEDWFNPEFVSNEEINLIKEEYIRRNMGNPNYDMGRQRIFELWKKTKSTKYNETNRNRLNREKELGFKFSSMGPRAGYIFNSPNRPSLSDGNGVTDEIHYEYFFDLGNSTYGDYMGKYGSELPSDTEIQRLGTLLLDSIKEIIFIGKKFQYNPISLCDCLTKSELSDAGKCKEVFLQKYGTKEPSTNQMKNDYSNCN